MFFFSPEKWIIFKNTKKPEIFQRGQLVHGFCQKIKFVLCLFWGAGGGGGTNQAREGSLLIFWIEKNAF